MNELSPPSTLSIDLLGKITANLVTSLRGDELSQRDLSQQLGYASNVVYQWESGRSAPSVENVWELASRLAHGERAANAARHLERGVRESLSELLDPSIGGTRGADSTYPSRTIARWRRGEATPDFPTYLHLHELIGRSALDELNTICDPALLDAAAGPWSRRTAIRTLFATMPNAARLLAAIELCDYQTRIEHDDEWLAEQTGLYPYEIAFILERLVDVGLAVWQGGRYMSQRGIMELTHYVGPVEEGVESFSISLSEAGQHELDLATELFFRESVQIWAQDDGEREHVVEGALKYEEVRPPRHSLESLSEPSEAHFDLSSLSEVSEAAT